MKSPQAVPWLTARRIFIALAVYFLLHVLSRTLVSDSAELDESEQLLQAQSWSWGYTGQPPLYTWLQSLFFAVLGRNILAVALLKGSLLFGTYYFVYRAAREILKEEQTALLSALGLFFLPQIAWESQRDLTHSVLAVTIAAGTLFVFLRLMQTGRSNWYVALGLVAGLGLLAKYNYGIFLLLLLCASGSLSDWRPRLFSPWMLVSLFLCLAISAGHWLWIVSNRDALIGAEQLSIRATTTWLQGWWAGGKSLLQALVNFAAPITLLFAGLFFKRPKVPGAEPLAQAESKLVPRIVIGTLVFCALAVLCFRAQFKDRWLQPLLFVLPIFFVEKFRDRLTPAKGRALVVVAGCIACSIILVMPAIPLSASLTKRPTRLNIPWGEFSAQLKEQGAAPEVIVTDSCLPGGNLKMHFPTALVLAPECKVIPPPTNTPWLVVWEVRGEGVPAELQSFLVKLRGAPFPELKPAYLEAPVKYFPERKVKLGYTRLE